MHRDRWRRNTLFLMLESVYGLVLLLLPNSITTKSQQDSLKEKQFGLKEINRSGEQIPVAPKAEVGRTKEHGIK
jgi:hypothetical protein